MESFDPLAREWRPESRRQRLHASSEDDFARRGADVGPGQPTMISPWQLDIPVLKVS